MIQRDAKGRFVKGNTGGGRKQTPQEFKDSLLALTAEALQTIVSVMRDKEASPALRLRAAESILDRCFGKPCQMIIERQEPEQMPDDGFLEALTGIMPAVFSQAPDEPKGLTDTE